MPVQGVGLEAHLAVERHDRAVGRDDERVDLDQVGVPVDRGFARASSRTSRRCERQLPSRPRPAAIRVAWKSSSPKAGSIVSFRIFSGVSAATSSISVPPSVDAMTMLRRRRPVEQHREVQLVGDVDALLDVEAVDLLALRSGLDRDERRPEHLLGELPHLGLRGRHTAVDAVGDDVDAADVGVLLEAAPCPAPRHGSAT